MYVEPNELISNAKKRLHLTDEAIGSWIGLKGNTFRYRRARNVLTLRQLRIIVNKADCTNEEILSLFGRKPEMMDREIQRLRKAVERLAHGEHTDKEAVR